MKKINLKITIDTATRRFEYVLIEGIKFSQNIFKYNNGNWLAELDNLSISADGDLDILIIGIGNPNAVSKMKIVIDNKTQGEYETYKPFNKNGYAQFNEEIKL